MNILLIYPETPFTFWSFRGALRFISKKSSEPPLGLLTIAAMLPKSWDLKLIDMNVTPLRDQDIQQADYVFLTGMNIHKNSFKRVLRRCNELGTKVVAGGPMITTDYQEFLGVDHFILNEAELTLPLFLNDLEKGCAKPLYSSKEFPDISKTPPPRWDLLDIKKYASMSIQYSRGCPYDCEFCSIALLNGRRPRVKGAQQFINELELLYQQGWRGSVFIVDDNFIGQKNTLKKELLPALIGWSEQYQFPFSFATEASINLAQDEQLLRQMVSAGFDHTFIGIETPNSDSLAECGKKQNLKHDLLSSVKKLHNAGLRVSGGFIIGFDNDSNDIFDQQIQFIQKSGIVTAMVGLLNAPVGSSLFKRLKKEKRLLQGPTGDNMDGSINFIPKMNYQELMAGYKKVLETIYAQKEYYERVKLFIQEYTLPLKKADQLSLGNLRAFIKSIWIMGFRESGKRYYWKLFFYSLLHYPKKFGVAITMAVYGFHFRQVVQML